jgi:hypothetical protein
MVSKCQRWNHLNVDIWGQPTAISSLTRRKRVGWWLETSMNNDRSLAVGFARCEACWAPSMTANISKRHVLTWFIARSIPLPRSYTVLRWCVDCKRSEAHERKKREKPLPRSYTVLCRFIYPNLRVRLHFLYGFNPVFSFFRTENCGFFSIYFRFRKPRNLHYFDNVRAFSGKFLGKIPR